jgi:hypothetical protein
MIQPTGAGGASCGTGSAPRCRSVLHGRLHAVGISCGRSVLVQRFSVRTTMSILRSSESVTGAFFDASSMTRPRSSSASAVAKSCQCPVLGSALITTLSQIGTSRGRLAARTSEMIVGPIPLPSRGVGQSASFSRSRNCHSAGISAQAAHQRFSPKGRHADRESQAQAPEDIASQLGRGDARCHTFAVPSNERRPGAADWGWRIMESNHVHRNWVVNEEYRVDPRLRSSGWAVMPFTGWNQGSCCVGSRTLGPSDG